MTRLRLKRFESADMELKPIHTEPQYRAALAESVHYPIADPDPIEFIKHVMDNQCMTRKDMEPYFGARGRVADILNRTRPLTLEMIRRLTINLKLPADVLVRPYPLRRHQELSTT